MVAANVAPNQIVKFKMGLPGQKLQIAFVPQFREQKYEDEPEGLKGRYRVIFVLCRPGFPLTAEKEFKPAEELKGDSHLAITAPVYSPQPTTNPAGVKIRCFTNDGDFEFTGVPNDKGFLGKVVSEPFEANSFYDAELKAYRALAATLSNLSIHLDIPLHVCQTESQEVRTAAIRYSILTPYFDSPFAIVPTLQMQAEFRGYASLYREALNSNSGVYGFLCFFKIIEAVRVRRARFALAEKKAGNIFARPVEDIPVASDFLPWLNALLPVRPDWGSMELDAIFPVEARGRRIGWVVAEILSPLRHNIAHALLSSSGALGMSADEMLNTREIDKWLPLTKCIARRMLKNEFPAEFLAHLKENGTIVSIA